MNTSELYSRFLLFPRISTDSRNILRGSLFFGLKGPTFNGNAFAASSLEKGAALAIVDEREYQTDERIILVEDSLESLQQLAAHHRQRFKVPVIGITGTNGKTTSKELIAAVLSKKHNVVSTRGNLNNHIGVPLTLLQMTSETTLAVVEMGANHPGEIATLCKLADPTHGLITNIGKAHLEGFGDLDGIIGTKKALYDHLAVKEGTAFVNADNTLLMSLTEGIHRITFGGRELYDFPGRITSVYPYLDLAFLHQGLEYPCPTRLVGAYNFENAMAAVSCGLTFGIEPKSVYEALGEYTPGNNRSQFVETGRNHLILDAYNANPTSMRAALEHFSRLPGHPKGVILGDMLELGDESHKEHLQILQLIHYQGYDLNILVGPVFSELNPYHNILCFPESESAAAYLMDRPISGFTMLLKGSRGIMIEKTLASL